MRHWKPKKEKGASPLPAPPLAYHEREASMAANYTASEWAVETVHRKAQTVAHYIHKMMRENYAAEKAMANGDKKSNEGQSYESLMKAMHMPGY